MVKIIMNRIKALLSKKATKVVIVSTLVVAIAGSYYLYSKSKTKATSGNIELRTTAVKKGDFTVNVSGSGPLASSNRVEISPKTTGTVIQVNFKEGEKVKVGDVLFELDDSTARLNVEKLKANISQSLLTQKSNVGDIQKLNIVAPFSGQVVTLNAKQGDTLAKSGNALTLVDKSMLKITVPFNSAFISRVKVGTKVSVNIQNFMETVEGYVTYVNNVSFSTSTGGELYNVEINIPNPGSLKDGMKANVIINTPVGDINSTDNGTLSYINSLVVKSETGGLVNSVLVKEGQFVQKGELMVGIINEDLVTLKDSTDLKLLDLKGQLDSAQQELSYYKVRSSIEGTIVKQTIRVGDIARSGTVITTISDNTQIECTIPIDELDVAKIKVGQKVSVVVDAIPETSAKPLQGEISKIAVEGTYANGVTTFPVTLKILNTDRLRGGMNANADISVASKKGALYVPIEAVQKVKGKTFVMVKADSELAAAASTKTDASKSDSKDKANSNQKNSGASENIVSSSGGLGYSGGTNKKPTVSAAADNSAMAMAKGNPTLAAYYAKVVMIPVEVGINNEAYMEIVAGLSEGDTVILPGKVPQKAATAGSMFGGSSGGGSSAGGAPRTVTGGVSR